MSMETCVCLNFVALRDTCIPYKYQTNDYFESDLVDKLTIDIIERERKGKANHRMREQIKVYADTRIHLVFKVLFAAGSTESLFLKHDGISSRSGHLKIFTPFAYGNYTRKEHLN